jgi:hypothetical protein
METFLPFGFPAMDVMGEEENVLMPIVSRKGDDRPARKTNIGVSRFVLHTIRGLEAAPIKGVFMHIRLLSWLSRRLVIAVLLVCLALGGISFALFQHVFNVHAAASSSNPYYVMVVGGQKFIAQYEGGSFNSDETNHSIYTDFGKWNEYTVDGHGTWHWYGQFSGNENTFVNGHGQLQTGVNVNVPGVGHINTYGHEDVLSPPLISPPGGYSVVGPEHYIGERVSVTPTQPLNLDCEVDEYNLDNGHLGGGTRQFINDGSQQGNDCVTGDNYLRSGDPGVGEIFRQLALSPHANGSMMTSLLQPQLPIPVILNIAGGVFFIAAISTGNICTFTTCSATAKKVLAAISIGCAILSVVAGQIAVNTTAMKAFASRGPSSIASIGSAAAGDVEMAGAVSPSLASRAASEASTISSLSARSSVSVVP